jgi:hypothetical protein
LKRKIRFDPLAEKIYPLGLKRKNPLEAKIRFDPLAEKPAQAP